MADYGGTGVSAQQVKDELKNRQTGPSLAQALEQGAKSTLGSTTPVVSTAYGVGATPKPDTITPITPGSSSSAIGGSAVGATNVPGATAPATTPPPATPAAPSPITPPVTPPLGEGQTTGQSSYPIQTKPIEPTAPQVTRLASLGSTMAEGYKPVESGSNVLTQGSTQTGMMPNPNQAKGEPASVPQYTTNYKALNDKGVASTMTIVGPDKRVGGGTVSVMDQGNGGTIEGNVAAINRQTAALTSLREAQNPGITTGTGAFAPRQESAAPVDPFARPGDGWGDSEKRYQEYQGLLREASSGKGLTKNQRAAKINAAQGLVAPGLEIAKLSQAGQNSKDSLAAQLAQNQAASQDRRFSAETASADRRYATDASLAGNRLTAEQQRIKNEIDAYSAVNPKQSGQDNLVNSYMTLFQQSTDPKLKPEERAAAAARAKELAPLIRRQENDFVVPEKKSAP